MRTWFKYMGTGTILIAPVLIGYILGRQVEPAQPPNYWTVQGVGALVLLLMGWSAAAWRPTATAPEWLPILCGFLALYAGGILIADPFVSRELDTLPGRALLLAPFLVALPVLLANRVWLGMAGAALFLIAATAVLTYNVCSPDSGVGFLRYWSN